jgi:GntR family transcriptional regulator, carbon starvation induced regulator
VAPHSPEGSFVNSTTDLDVGPSSIRLDTASGSLSTSMADELRLAILSGELLPGAPLRLSNLKTRFDVSLSPLREALLKLAGEGYVVAEDQRGFRVAPVSKQNFDEITVLRRKLEPEALKLSMLHGKTAWENQLVVAFHHLAKIEQTSLDSDLQQWEGAHRAFHWALISGCEMPVMLQFCRTLLNLSDRYRRIFLFKNPHDRNVPSEHSAIYERALARDVDGASTLLEQHIVRTGNALARYVKSQ